MICITRPYGGERHEENQIQPRLLENQKGDYMKIRLCNWQEYQHYKDRCPPWIKLHSNLLNSRLWVMCDDASRVLAFALMILASKHGNEIPMDEEYIKAVSRIKKFELKPLIDIGFCEMLDNACNVLADASALLSSPLISSLSNKGSVRGKREVVFAADFVSFWKAYPRKVGKGAAMKAWEKARPPLDKCLATLRWQSQSEAWRKDNGQFIPHPATWLNQARWEDEPETQQEKGRVENPQAKYNGVYQSAVAALRDVMEKFPDRPDVIEGVLGDLRDKHTGMVKAVNQAWADCKTPACGE